MNFYIAVITTSLRNDSHRGWDRCAGVDIIFNLWVEISPTIDFFFLHSFFPPRVRVVIITVTQEKEEGVFMPNVKSVRPAPVLDYAVWTMLGLCCC